MIKYIVYTLILISINVNSQEIFGPQQVLVDDLTGVQNLAVGDITGNGFQDLLATGGYEMRIALLENSENGFGNLAVLHEGETPRGITAIDINGDAFLDVAFSINSTNSLFYMLNNGGGSFSEPILIVSLILNINDLKAADIDGDGDQDIMMGSGFQTRWYENVDGAFPIEHILNGPSGRIIDVGDLDGDGDLDIASTASGSTTCVWYENDGTGNFSDNLIIRGPGNASRSVFISDINGDGLNDILLAINADNTVMWFENLGNGIFSNEILINTNVEFPRSIAAADLDNDGDADVISGGNGQNDSLVWFENLDGLGTFSDQILITEEVDDPHYILAVDLDNDGDIDLASASRNDHTVAWYENLTILGTNGPKAIKFEVYPNPSSTDFIIQVTPGSAAGFTLYDIHGKELQNYPANTESIDARALATGVYLLELETLAGEKISKKLVKE